MCIFSHLSMDLLSRGFNAVLGGERGTEGDRDETTAGVVEKLCLRLTTSTLIQDRRDAMRALRCCCLFVCLFTCLFTCLLLFRSLSQSEEDYRVEVGAQALSHIVSCLEERDPELCQLTLEAILGLIGTPGRSELNLTFSEIVLKQTEVLQTGTITTNRSYLSLTGRRSYRGGVNRRRHSQTAGGNPRDQSSDSQRKREGAGVSPLLTRGHVPSHGPARHSGHRP